MSVLFLCPFSERGRSSKVISHYSIHFTLHNANYVVRKGVHVSKKFEKLWNTVSAVLVALVVLVAFATIGIQLFGITPYIVLSGSMEPKYHTGSLIYVVEKETSKLEAGDVITFQLKGGTIVTHRIVEVINENGSLGFRTKGDANDIEDASIVLAEQVIGTPTFSIPYLGYLVTYMKTTSGRFATMAIAAGILLLTILPDLILNKKGEEKEE